MTFSVLRAPTVAPGGCLPRIAAPVIFGQMIDETLRYWSYASTKSFSRMISAGVASGGQARAAGVDFANFLGAMGFREFRELV